MARDPDIGTDLRKILNSRMRDLIVRMRGKIELLSGLDTVDSKTDWELESNNTLD